PHLGSLALGSAAWGVVASWLGVAAALDAAAVLLAASLALALPWNLDVAAVEAPAAEPLPPARLRTAVVAAARPALARPAVLPPVVARSLLPAPAAAVRPRNRDLTGQSLGPYRLEERTREGTLGHVYRAQPAAPHGLP